MAEELAGTEDLTVQYRDTALAGVTLSVRDGEVLGIFGPSGSGKSTLAMAVAGLLPAEARVTGKIRVRAGSRIGFLFQDPRIRLNPVLRIGTQLEEVLRSVGVREGLPERALGQLRECGFGDPERVFRAYAHQLSGGECQRVALAQALLRDAGLLVADEPTASIDAPRQAELVKLLRRLARERGVGQIVVSHSPAVLWHVADRVAVLEGGRLVECGAVKEVLPRAARR